MDVSHLPTLLAAAWLLPLASFVVIVLFGKSLGPHGKYAGFISIGAIVTGFVLSCVAMFGIWLPTHPLADASHHGDAHGESHGDNEHHDGDADKHDDVDEHTTGINGSVPLLARPAVDAGYPISTAGQASSGTELTLVAMQPAEGDAGPEAVEEQHAPNPPPPYHAGDWYSLGEFGKLKLTIGYYIDTLTVTMFCMVTLIASCVHIYAFGYMHDELHDPYVDHEVTLSDGHHLHRPGRFHRFFQYLSLFSFSMLGLVIAGNVAMVFVFWELVGICS